MGYEEFFQTCASIIGSWRSRALVFLRKAVGTDKLCVYYQNYSDHDDDFEEQKEDPLGVPKADGDLPNYFNFQENQLYYIRKHIQYNSIQEAKKISHEYIMDNWVYLWVKYTKTISGLHKVNY